MCFEDRNTLSRSRPPEAALMVRRMRALRRSTCLVGMVPSLLLALLAEDIFARIPHALALVGLGRPEAADFRRDLADLLFVDAGHQDFGRLRGHDRDALRDRVDHVMAVAERDMKDLALDSGALADARDIELALEALGDAGDQIGDERARRAPHGEGAICLAARVDLDGSLVHLD